jgi:uncharacterized delta-60 repeat protein
MKCKVLFHLTRLQILIVLITANNISSQVTESWVKRYDGPGSSTDKPNAIAVDKKGNVFVTGSSPNAGFATEDYATIKYNSEGTQLWVSRYNGTGSSTDKAYAIVIDSAGYAIVTGGSWGLGTNFDYLTIKYTPLGDTVWTRRYNGPKNGYDIAYSVALDDSGNIFVTGESEGTIGTHGIFSDYATVKYNSDGIFQWAARYNGPAGDYDRVNSISVDDAGNVYVTGISDGGSSGSSDPHFDCATIKYNSSGIAQWVRRYNGTANSNDEALMIKTDTLGNVFVTGYSTGDSSAIDYVTICYSASGDTIWTSRYNGEGNSADRANALICDNLGNVFVTGKSYGGSTTDYDIVTIKYNSAGDSVWIRSYNGSLNNIDEGKAIALDKSGNVFVTGSGTNVTTDFDYTTIKYSPDGTEEWTMKYTNSDFAGSSEEPSGLFVDTLYNVYVTGVSALDYATVKYTQTPTSVSSSLVQNPNEFSLEQNYPNPFNPTTTIGFRIPEKGNIRMSVLNILGEEIRVLLNEEKETGYHSINFDASSANGGLPSGVYFYRIQSGNFIDTKKMLLLK